ncbi:TniB family NTP-binding protein [Acidiphilium sp. PA]|uniref:TniB family NTP-binding protein n=1 Tax=Acidiphilium sp. PA TaxID=2871705 RepID=UPI0022435E2C|nr:TniB family NTP-binding protein [Acidiphilium sp. PA]MCW8309451.1 TniB family NTP-binding protein [Acidiphilium sp. PA]
MSLEHSHLVQSAASLLDRSDSDRIAIREERWITYPRARWSLEMLDELLVRPRTTRMPSIAVYADSGMGKTMLMERFRRAHPAIYNREQRRLISPVLALQMASHATERRFYGHLLQAIGVPFVPRATVLELEVQIMRNLKRMEVKLLMLDEVHNLLAGSAKEQRILLNTLRFISNELQISLVCLGIADARDAIGGDVQLMRRFEELTLPRWQGDEEFEQLVVIILRHLPLKLASQVSARALRQVLEATDGVTARIFGMFNDLAIAAIRSGRECINDTSVEAWRPIGKAMPAYA